MLATLVLHPCYSRISCLKQIVVAGHDDNYGPEHPRNLIPELCRLFYSLGWVTGTGGGVTIKQG